MWTSLFKNTDNNSLLKNRHFRNYLSQTQLNSIKNKLDYKLHEKSNIKKEDNDFLLEGYLDKIHNPLNDNFIDDELKNNKLVCINSNNFVLNNFKTNFKTHLFLFALTSLTTSIGYYFYLLFKK
jgi:hypothetical protein